MPARSRPSPGSRSARAWCCSFSPGRFRSGCMVSNRGFLAAAAAALLASACASTPPPAPAIHINEDPYPSTYVRYPGVLTVIRHATVFTGDGQQIDNGTVVFADGLIQAVGGPELASPAGALEIDGTG